MENLDALKIIFVKNKFLREDFGKFIADQMYSLGEKSFDFTLENFIEKYLISRTLSLTKLHAFFRSLDSKVLDELLMHKDYPKIYGFIPCIPTELKESKTFSLADGLTIINNYALSKTLGINEKHSFYLNKIRAERQSENLIKKDLNGLLGISNLFKKEIKKKPKHNPQSVWTVKKK